MSNQPFGLPERLYAKQEYLLKPVTAPTKFAVKSLPSSMGMKEQCVLQGEPLRSAAGKGRVRRKEGYCDGGSRLPLRVVFEIKKTTGKGGFLVWGSLSAAFLNAELLALPMRIRCDYHNEIIGTSQSLHRTSATRHLLFTGSNILYCIFQIISMEILLLKSFCRTMNVDSYELSGFF